MIKRFTVVFAFLSLFFNALGYAQAPANDNCADAVNLVLGAAPVNGSTINATNELGIIPATTCWFGAPNTNVWYKFTTTAAGNYVISTDYLGSSGSPELKLFSGTCGTFTELACASGNGVTNAAASIIRICLNAATTYYVAVDNRSIATGTFQITVAANATAPSNDCCANPTNLVLNAAPIAGTNANSTTQAVDGPISCWGTVPSHSVWYSFTTGASGSYTISTDNGGTINTQMKLFSGSCGSLTELVCNENGGTTNANAAVITRCLDASTTYMVLVDVNGTGTGGFNINVRHNATAPSNDCCFNAQTLTVGAACVNGTTINATTDNTDPATTCWGSAPSHSVWYKFTTGPSGGNYRISTDNGGTTDTQLKLFTGSCGSFTEVICNEDGGTANATSGVINAYCLPANTTYYIMVDVRNAATGTFCISVDQPAGAGPANDCCVNAVDLIVGAACTNGTNVGALSDVADPAQGCWASASSHTVWYKFTTSTAGSYTVSTDNGGTTNTQLKVFSGTCGSFTQVGCVEDGGVTNVSSARVTMPCLAANTTYYVLVDVNGTATGTFCINVTQNTGGAANDCCFNAVTLTVGATCTTGSNAGSTADAGDPVQGCWLSASSHTVWYKFTTSSPGDYRISTNHPGTTTDTQLKLLSGSCGSFTLVSCNEDSVAGNTKSVIRASCLNANTTYYILADMRNATTANFCISVVLEKVVNPDIEAVNVAAGSPPLIVANGSTHPVSFTFRNNSCPGVDFTSASVGYRLNNNAPVLDTWTGTLAAGASLASPYTFSTQVTFTTAGLNVLKVWVNNPGPLGPDTKPLNDTLTVLVYVEGEPAPPVAYSANDFWYCFTNNEDYGGPPNTSYQLVINSVHCASGTITFPRLTGVAPISFKVTPGTVTTVNVPKTNLPNNEIYNIVPNTVANNGFHIISDSVINVNMVEHQQASVDAENILPTSMLGKAYVATSRSHNFPGTAVVDQVTTMVTVGATEDNTTVRIYDNTTGVDRTIRLNAGQTYMLTTLLTNCNSDATQSSSNDVLCHTFAGTVFVSDKPTYVQGHSDPTTIGYCGARDYVVGQALPVAYWSNEYILAQPIKRNSPLHVNCAGDPSTNITSMADFVEIIGKAGTNVTFNNLGGNVTMTIPAFGTSGYGYIWYINQPPAPATGPEQYGECNLRITSTAPIQVYQYGQGYQGDNAAATGNTDPEMILVYPRNFWTNQYIFAASPSATNFNYVVIVVDNTPSNTISQFNLDGAAVPPVGWQAIGTTSYRFIRVQLPIAVGSTQSHYIRHTAGKPFAIYVNAVGPAESYTVQLGGSPVRVPWAACLAVPVELLSFTAVNRGETNVLNWITATEQGNKNFVIERSLDGNGFQEIGTVDGSGNSTSTRSYTFTDGNITPGNTYYYRLKQVDQTGEFSYSDVVSLNILKSNLFELKTVVYNSSLSTLNVTLNSTDGGKGDVIVYDLLGHQICGFNQVFQEGDNRISCQTELKAGAYFLKIRKGEQIINSKFIIH
jgi:hypothetical protein